LILAGRGQHWLSPEIIGEPRQRSANAPRGAAGALSYDLPKNSEFYGRPTLTIYVIFSVGDGIPQKNKHILGPPSYRLSILGNRASAPLRSARRGRMQPLKNWSNGGGVCTPPYGQFDHRTPLLPFSCPLPTVWRFVSVSPVRRITYSLCASLVDLFFPRFLKNRGGAPRTPTSLKFSEPSQNVT